MVKVSLLYSIKHKAQKQAKNPIEWVSLYSQVIRHKDHNFLCQHCLITFHSDKSSFIFVVDISFVLGK